MLNLLFNDLHKIHSMNNLNFKELERFSAPKRYLISAEVFKNDDDFTVQFPLAGYTKDQLSIEFEKGFLTVSAEIDEETKFVSTFSETIYVSDNINSDKITAAMENGILDVVMPIEKSKKVKRIKLS